MGIIINEFNHLPTIPLEQVAQLKIDENVDAVNLQNPATYVMTDFTRRSLQLIDSNTSIDNALNIMCKSHVKSKIVIDDNLVMLGIVNLADLLSRKVLMVANKKA